MMKKLSEIQNRESFLYLLGASLNNEQLDKAYINGLNGQDWEELFLLANYHGVAALLGDAIVKNTSIAIPTDVRLKFIGIQEITEKSYHHHLHVMAELLTFFNKCSITTMVIKGLSLAQYYPFPAHRKCGDIDIYQYGKHLQSDQLISKSFGIKIKKNIVGHHTNYLYKDISIENHYQFVTTYFGGGTYELETLLENEAKDAIRFEINKQGVFFPSPLLNAIFLPYHMAVHFRSEKVTMRQMIDWMMFLQAEYNNVDWQRVHDVYKSLCLFDFVNAINGILINRFNMPVKYASRYVRNNRLENQVFNDMMKISVEEIAGGSRINRIWYRYFRNGWKFRMFGSVGIIVLFRKIWAYIKHDDSIVVIYESVV